MITKQFKKLIAISFFTLLAGLELSAAGVRFKNGTTENIAVRITSKGVATAPETCLFIGAGATNEWDAGLGGIQKIEYMYCGALYTLNLDIQGISGMRDYSLNAQGNSIWISGVGLDPVIGDKAPTLTWRSKGTCCPACPKCPTFTIGG